ncbi:TVP38/TMEM64 family protein [Bacillus taeanensis]|uniref:TVP38/TMEM64 family membrane protein n=1 Tax=Bacillus taeanensis TaxID=273032 RepID=A0A366Y179_9BACI|nr:VTT domain-containing protein [Bacillus taeanensis]RBW70174.1 hypothetical protein DS031_08275 [Bacillus taeanensis]
MEKQITELLSSYKEAAIFISICINILIAILGVVPTVFITSANIAVFGFWEGALLSFIGESIGAAAAFWLYRKGFKKISQKELSRFKKGRELMEVRGRNAFYLILAFRLLPFIPSGVVTFFAAIGSVSISIFVLASSLGKVPAMFIEAYSVYQVTNLTWQGKVILFLAAIYILMLVFRKRKSANH